MSVKIGSNISSLKAQRQLTRVTTDISSTFQRLSSGLRINKASDDAAGLAVLSGLTTDKRVFTQGLRNLNDGISLLNVADSSINELTNITVRLKELAEQASNGVYGVKQRAALDAEAQALSKEFTRITRSTTYNGKGIFYSEFGSFRVQGGYGNDGGIQSGLGGNIGTGSFGSTISTSVTNPIGLSVTDFNADGIADVVIANGADDRLAVMLGVGDGTFSNSFSATLLAGTSGIAVKNGDFNNDGIMDIAAESGTDLSIFIGNGNGSFQNSISTVLFDNIYTLDVGDLNNDGNSDITYVSGGGVLGTLLGSGDGTFTTGATYSNTGNPENLVLADFNKDGLLDLVTSDEDEDTYSIYLGSGNGTFGTRTSIDSGVSEPQEVQVGDLNNDGNLDLVINPKNSNTSVSVIFGNGNGTFSTSVTYSAGSGIESTTLADFNGDGNLDIGIASSSSDKIHILLNAGDGTFATAMSYAVITDPLRIKTGDFNGDGVADLISTSSTSDAVAVNLGAATSGISPLAQFTLKTKADALQSLSLFNTKLIHLTTHRGQIGAFQSRLEVAKNTLSSTVENYNAAASRLSDADIALETSQLVRQQILQKSSTAILAQANLQPGLAVSLLAIKS